MTKPRELDYIRHQEWRQHAACSFLADPSVMDHTRAAKQVCRRCPVAWECLRDALAHPNADEGVRGGYTLAERREARRA